MTYAYYQAIIISINKEGIVITINITIMTVIRNDLMHSSEVEFLMDTNLTLLSFPDLYLFVWTKQTPLFTT